MVTEEANHLTEDFNVLQEDGIHCVILGLQTETGLLFEEAFAGSLVIIIHGDHDITVTGSGLLAEQPTFLVDVFIHMRSGTTILILTTQNIFTSVSWSIDR